MTTPMTRWYDVQLGAQIVTVAATDAGMAHQLAASLLRRPVYYAIVIRVQTGTWHPFPVEG